MLVPSEQADAQDSVGRATGTAVVFAVVTRRTYVFSRERERTLANTLGNVRLGPPSAGQHQSESH
jgi:hypothetical protein